MISNVRLQRQVVREPVQEKPLVTVLMPFDPKMTSRSVIARKLLRMLIRAEEILYRQYPIGTAVSLVQQLQEAMAGLDYTGHRRSLMLQVREEGSAIHYLNADIHEGVYVGATFDPHHIAAVRPLRKRYLLLHLGESESRLYRGMNHQLELTLVCRNHRAARAASTPGGADACIRYLDDSLRIMLQAFPLPLIVTGSRSMEARFRQASRHRHTAAAFLPAEPGLPESRLVSLVQSGLRQWKQIVQRDAEQRLEAALQAGNLDVGVREAWDTARRGAGKLLVVERDYTYPAALPVTSPETTVTVRPTEVVKDAVRSLVELVLKNGGDVLYVEPGTLKDYLHLALIRYSDTRTGILK
ncbi:MAG TPA: hypothetical protein VHK69_18970 [Chitinophagaceae bacterium]|nr:hypothetical protein [Chitinophagaceae bacterium]